MESELIIRALGILLVLAGLLMAGVGARQIGLYLSNRRKLTKADLANSRRMIGCYVLPPDGIRKRRGTKKTKLKWRNIIPALLVGGAVSFVVWHTVAYCCGLMHMTMLVPVWAILDSVVFVVASMVAVMHINTVAAQKAVNQKIDWNKVQKFQKLSELKRMGVSLEKLGLNSQQIQALEDIEIYTVEGVYGRLSIAADQVGNAIGVHGEELTHFTEKVREVLGPESVAELDSLGKEEYGFGCNE